MPLSPDSRSSFTVFRSYGAVWMLTVVPYPNPPAIFASRGICTFEVETFIVFVKSEDLLKFGLGGRSDTEKYR